MTDSNNLTRCTGKVIPFGYTYNHTECQSCSRRMYAQTEKMCWMGPVTFSETCPFKIEAGK